MPISVNWIKISSRDFFFIRGQASLCELNIHYDSFVFNRRALKEAYFQLAKDEQGINFHDFMYFMLEYKPRIREESLFVKIYKIYWFLFNS